MNYYQNYGYCDSNQNFYSQGNSNLPVNYSNNNFPNLQVQKPLTTVHYNIQNYFPCQIPFGNFFHPPQQPQQQQHDGTNHARRRVLCDVANQPAPILRRSERLKKTAGVSEPGQTVVDPAQKAKTYKIGKILGEGAFSKVYLAKNLQHNTTVALKKIEMDRLSEKYTDLCVNEIKLLKAVNSPYVVKFLDSFPQNRGKTLCVVLELMDSGDLSNLIETLRARLLCFSERILWYYFHQICAGLAALHERRILHRDLKPANVFLKADGRCKLGDLGLSKLFNSDSNAATRVGTEYYFSPERNESHGYHFKSDIWSLGCLLFEMCTLRSPFNGETINAYSLHKKIAQGEIPPLPMESFSRFVKHFVKSCMSVNPDHRPTAEQCRISSLKIHNGFQILMQERKKLEKS